MWVSLDASTERQTDGFITYVVPVPVWPMEKKITIAARPFYCVCLIALSLH
jgi:hypothetical protein